MIRRAIPGAVEVLDFWFGELGSEAYGKPRPEWFKKSDEFDATIRDRFGHFVEQAVAGELADWSSSERDPRVRLAYILLIDQFTRNIYRNSARMYAGDPLALKTAKSMVELRQDQDLAPLECSFAYMPFEHSESLGDQIQSLALFHALSEHEDGSTGNLFEYAHKHYIVVERFGRFPHRNEILGRRSTAEEIEYLKQPGAGF